MTMTDEAADSGVKVVGATTTDDEEKNASPREMARRGRARSASVSPTRRSFRIVSVLAIVGLLGTLVFGILYATKSSGSGQNPAVTSAAQTFLEDFFNFNAKSVDTDFSAITDMATGQFSTQAKQFFNSSIRTELEQALAESRGQIRALYVQSETPTTAAVYAVIDQTYVNNKITSPEADVVRLVVNLENVGGTWKISNVTVLEGASPASEGTASGSSGSNVPGQ
jgi:hypothetical protein